MNEEEQVMYLGNEREGDSITVGLQKIVGDVTEGTKSRYLLIEYRIDDFQGAGLFLLGNRGVGEVGIWNPRRQSGGILTVSLEKSILNIGTIPFGCCITGICITD